MKRYCFLLILMLPAFLTAESILDDYVCFGLSHNLALQQKQFRLKQAQAALNEARGLFLPSITLDARYSRAGGGRMIEIPIRDLTEMMGQLFLPPGTPVDIPASIQNVTEPFLREKEHETKMRVIQPLFQPRILFNYQMKREMKGLEQASRDIFARHLIAEIKTAYYNYLKAKQIVSLLEKTRELLEENVRVSKHLYKNDKVTKAVVYRAEAELHAFEQQKAEADKGLMMTESYFNFLLNRDMDSTIKSDSCMQIASELPVLSASIQTAVNHREEIEQLNTLIQVMDKKVKLNQAGFMPGVSAVFDYGYQGETYEFGAKDDYWMLSVAASWNLFNGFQDKYKVDQSRYEKKQAEAQCIEIQNQIRLQVQQAHQNLIVGLQQLEASKAESVSAAQSFRIVEVQFREGMASQIEFIDARNAKTNAEVKAAMAQFDYLIKQAEWEKVTAAYVFKNEDRKGK